MANCYKVLEKFWGPRWLILSIIIRSSCTFISDKLSALSRDWINNLRCTQAVHSFLRSRTINNLYEQILGHTYIKKITPFEALVVLLSSKMTPTSPCWVAYTGSHTPVYKLIHVISGQCPERLEVMIKGLDLQIEWAENIWASMAKIYKFLESLFTKFITIYVYKIRNYKFILFSMFKLICSYKN